MQWLKSRRDGWRIARTKTTGTSVFIRSRIGSPVTEHVHVELVPRDQFASAPKTNATLSEIRAELEPLMGQPVSVDVESTFLLPAKRLPPFIRSRLVKIETESGVSITSRGGKLAVEGGPLYMITWSLRGENDASVLLEAAYDWKISDRYLEDLLLFMDTTFKALILGENRNERP
ncbi:MAG TPA: hypothetical protein PK867_19945 [Pirellulales bacterium]|nr:hypothetical protein [Pirellulales bacterium]